MLSRATVLKRRKRCHLVSSFKMEVSAHEHHQIVFFFKISGTVLHKLHELLYLQKKSRFFVTLELASPCCTMYLLTLA